MITKECLQCKNKFETKRQGKRTNVVCSVLCRNKYCAEKRRSTKYPLYLTDCVQCGAKVYAKNASFVKPWRKYCDKACKQRHERTGVAMSKESKVKLAIAKTVHGHSYNKLWKVWSEIIRRCDPQKGHLNYGLRGILVSEEWKVFEPFQEWALENGYKEGLTIERMNVNGNYCKENCTWIPMSEQAKNRRPVSEWKFKNKSYLKHLTSK